MTNNKKMVKGLRRFVIVVAIMGAFLLGGLVNSARRTRAESFGQLVTLRNGNTVVTKVMNYDAWKENTLADFAANLGFQVK